MMRSAILGLSLALGVGAGSVHGAELDVIGAILADPERKLRIGYRFDAPPFSSGPRHRGTADKPKGFTVSICGRIVGEVIDSLEAFFEHRQEGSQAVSAANRTERRPNQKLETEWIPVPLGERWRMIEERNIDLLCGATTITRQRMAFLDFSVMYFVTGAIAIVDLESVTIDNAELTWDMYHEGDVGVISTSSSAATIHERFNEPRSFPDFEAALQALDRQEIKILVGDRELLHLSFDNYAENQENKDEFLQRFAFSEQLTYEPYAIPMRKGEHRLKCLVDTAIAKFFEDGYEDRRTLRVVFKENFERDIEKATMPLKTLFLINRIPSGNDDSESASCISGRRATEAHNSTAATGQQSTAQ